MSASASASAIGEDGMDALPRSTGEDGRAVISQARTVDFADG